MKGLVQKVYKLDSLNERYEKFLARAKVNPANPWLKLEYLAILRDDPQLPFELLPSNWKGKEANSVYERIGKNHNN